MAAVEAMIRRVPKGGTRSIKALARQLGYLSRLTDPERENILLVGAQRHEFNPGTPDAVDPNDVRAFARRLYVRSGRLPPGNLNAELPNDLTMHFVISFPHGTDVAAAERAGRDWAEGVFGQGFRNDQGFVERHDYVTAFHNHGAQQDHPHMHVVVDRVPLGGGNLLSLSEGHAHWSYEAMRLQAVEAAADHGIELVATPHMRTGMTRPITEEEAELRRRAARRVPYHDPYFDVEGHAPEAGELGGDGNLEALRQACEPVLVPDPGEGADNDDGGSNGGNGRDGGGAGGGATSQAQRQGQYNLAQDVGSARGSDDGGLGAVGAEQLPPPTDQPVPRRSLVGPSDSVDNQQSNLSAENLAQLERAGESFDAERARQTQRWIQRVQREEEIEDEDGRRRRFPERRTDGAIQAREAQRQADRAQREQAFPSEDERRRRLPAHSGLHANSAGSDLLVQGTAGPDSQAAVQVSPLDAARHALQNARTAMRAHQEAQPRGGTEEALRVWRAERKQRIQDVRRAQTELNIARFGRPNVATRATAERTADAARQVQTDQRRADREQLEEEAQREENLRRRTPQTQERPHLLSSDAAQRDHVAVRQALHAGGSNVTTHVQAQAEQSRNEREQQRDRLNPGPSRSSNHRWD